MAQMNTIKSFKTFSQLKAEEKEIQLKEEAKSKRDQLVTKIAETLVEMDITSFDELSEEEKKTLVAKLFNEESEVEITTKGDVELEINQEEEEESEEKVEEAHKKLHGPLHQLYKKIGSKKFIEAVGLVMSGADIEFTIKTAGEKVDDYYDIEEGNAFIYAAAKAKQAGEDSFEFNGKTYEVKLKADTGLKESYQLLITEATRWQFGKIDKRGNITSTYVHYDGYPSSVIPNLDDYDSKAVDQVLKDAEMGGMSSLGKNPKQNKYYNDSETSTLGSGNVKKLRDYLKNMGDEAGAEYVYLYDERDGQWYGADVFTDRELKPVEQLNEATIYEAKGDFAGWIAMYNGKKLEIDKSEANDLWGAKQLAIQKLKVPKSKQGILAIQPAVEESVVTEANVSGAYNDLENLLGTDMETMNDFQRIEDEGTWKEMSDFIEMAGDDEVLRRYKIKSRKDIDKLAKYIIGESVVTEAKKYDTLDDFEKDAKIGTVFYLGSEDQFKRSSKKDYYKITGKKSDGSLIVNRGTSKKKYTIGADRYDEPVIIVKESVVTEAEIKSDEDFKEYAETVLKKAFGEDYDEVKAGEVIDGLISKYSGDYGAMVGALQSSLD